ncbi:MAG: hypothetical protein DRQ41_10020 [Gammaproteobacteria bacterium]|nr:MAG: hypothetical protein DRQ41_10020 [Gammaproteobacteria bacterium]
MKNSRTIIFVSLFITGVIIYIGYWLYTHFEIITEEVEVGFRGKARDNPLLAAERLLTRMGTSATTVQSLSDSDLGLGDTLVLLQYDTSLDDEQTQELINWVDSGGHLIIAHNRSREAQKDTSQPNNFVFEEISVTQHQNGLDENEIAPPTEFIWGQYRLQVAFNPNDYLENEHYPAEKISDDYGTHLLSYYYGAGILSVLSDLEFIENDKISEYDHAQFLWQLVNFDRVITRVWLLRTYMGSHKSEPSLWILLWQNLWTMIISGILLLLFWLWAASRRFGPLLPVPPKTRRRLLEHIEASGHFLWRQHQTTLLRYSAVQALLKRLESVHPDWVRLSHTQLSQRLAEVCGLPAEEIEKALSLSKLSFTKNRQPVETEVTFTQSIQILTQIRKKL